MDVEEGEEKSIYVLVVWDEGFFLLDQAVWLVVNRANIRDANPWRFESGGLFLLLNYHPLQYCQHWVYLAALGSPHGIGWELKEWTKLTMEPSRMTKELRPIGPFQLEVLKSCRATGNITPTPIHIQLNVVILKWKKKKQIGINWFWLCAAYMGFKILLSSVFFLLLFIPLRRVSVVSVNFNKKNVKGSGFFHFSFFFYDNVNVSLGTCVTVIRTKIWFC